MTLQTTRVSVPHPQLTSDDRQATPTVASASKDLRTIAAKHKVRIDEKQMSFFTTDAFTIAHAPVVGLERYTEDAFAAGAPIQAILVNSAKPARVPNGTYLVKAQFQPGAKTGKALLIAANGTLVAQLDLIVRTRRELANIFPDVYSTPLVDIPVITSTHVWLGNQAHIGETGPYGHWGVDCMSSSNGPTLYYWE
jgi:hypothetical protein